MNVPDAPLKTISHSSSAAPIESESSELMVFVHDVMREDDANDPLLEGYQQYRGKLHETL